MLCLLPSPKNWLYAWVAKFISTPSYMHNPHRLITSVPLSERSIVSVPWASHNSITVFFERLSKSEPQNMKLWQTLFHRALMINQSFTASNLSSIFTSMCRAKVFNYKFLEALKQSNTLQTQIQTASTTICYQMIITLADMSVLDSVVWSLLLQRIKAVTATLRAKEIIHAMKAFAHIGYLDYEIEGLFLKHLLLSATEELTPKDICTVVLAIATQYEKDFSANRTDATSMFFSGQRVESLGKLSVLFVRELKKANFKHIIKIAVAFYRLGWYSLNTSNRHFLNILLEETNDLYKLNSSLTIYPLLSLKEQLLSHHLTLYNYCCLQLQNQLRTAQDVHLVPLLNFVMAYKIDEEFTYLIIKERFSHQFEDIPITLLRTLILYWAHFPSLYEKFDAFLPFVSKRLSSLNLYDLAKILKIFCTVQPLRESFIWDLIKCVEDLVEIPRKYMTLEECRLEGDYIKFTKQIVSLAAFLSDQNFISEKINKCASTASMELTRFGIPY